jgi:hypothetical protein
MKPMTVHAKDGTPVLARLRHDLANERSDLDRISGLWVVVRHPGMSSDGFDPGWNLAGPFGFGGMPDEWFTGWLPLPQE